MNRVPPDVSRTRFDLDPVSSVVGLREGPGSLVSDSTS